MERSEDQDLATKKPKRVGEIFYVKCKKCLIAYSDTKLQCPNCGSPNDIEHREYIGRLGRETTAAGSKREMPKSEPPTICPIMTIAHSDSLVTSDCEKEKCWWYNRTLKKCAFVHMAISLHELGLTLGYKGTSDLIKKP